MKEIGKIQPGQWDSTIKSFKALDFLPNIFIQDGYLSKQLGDNSWMEVDYTGTVNWIDFSFLNLNNEIKQLSEIPNDNGPIKIYDDNDKYIFTNGTAYIPTTKYHGDFTAIDIPIDICTQKKIGKMVRFEEKPKNKKVSTKSLFKLTKKSGPIDFIFIEDTLISIGNKYGSRVPSVKNAWKDNLSTKPTAILRSFKFDQFIQAKELRIFLYKVHDDPDWILNTPCTWLYVEMDLDTLVTVRYFERLIPVSKHNWRS